MRAKVSRASVPREPVTHAAPLATVVAIDEANRRPELIRAAARLFREKGFDGTTVRDIAQAVGMRSGSPFYHFASKQEILLAVMEEGLRQGLARMEAVLGHDLGPRERFAAMVKAHLGIILEDGNDFIPVMLYDWRVLDEAHRKRIIATKDRYDAIWQQVIEQLSREGYLQAQPKFARLTILGAMNFMMTWYKRGEGLSIDDLASQLVDLFLVR
jgi:TetR/AcrR family transcriptional regulator, cholesterol catabolism regulator